MEEFSHFCECPRCFDLCYSLSESEVETFLCTQFFRTEDILRDSHPSLTGQIGSFRLWLDWNRFNPAFKAFLLAVGMFQVISVGVNSENPLASLPDWSTLGARRSLQGSLCLFCAEGFKKVANNLNPFKGIVFSLFSEGHILTGPTVLGHAKCPCGQDRRFTLFVKINLLIQRSL